MPKSFSLFLALRYLKPKRTFLSIITLISILGVTLGIMVLILVISVMTGFEQELRRKVIGFDPHVVVTSGGVLEEWETTAASVKNDPDVMAAAPFVLGPVIAQYQNRRLAPKIRGVDPEMERGVVDITPFIIKGEYDLEGSKTIVGSELARELGVTVGETLTIFSPGNFKEILNEIERLEKTGGKPEDIASLKQLILPTELEVTGIFESGRYLYDSEFLIVPLHIGQELYNLGPAAHGLAVKTRDPYLADKVRNDLNSRIEPPAFAMSWMDMNKQIFDAIRMERQVMFFILMFIILVAAFGIMNTLITVTVQKTREIGVMKALGARTNQNRANERILRVVGGFGHAWIKRNARPNVNSLVAQSLHRVESRSEPSRDQRRHGTNHKRAQANDRDIRGHDLGGNFAELVNRRRKNLHAECAREKMTDLVAVLRKRDSHPKPDERSKNSDDHSLG